MGDARRILLVAYNYPPLISPQSLRWFYLSRELATLGYDIDVLTIRLPAAFRELSDRVPESIRVHRVFPGPLHYLTYRFSREVSRKERREKKAPRCRSFAAGALSSLYFAVYKILSSVAVPDIYAEWVPFAVARGRRLVGENAYDIIISSSEPRACHIVGFLLKKKASVPWIADYGDPWLYRPGQKIAEKLERKLLSGMDALTFAAEGTKRLYLGRHHFLKDRDVRVVTQGFDPRMNAEAAGYRPPEGVFRIVYCGSLYKGLRDPMIFFDAVREIGRNDIEVLVAGRINQFADILRRPEFAGTITFLGFLPHLETLALQKGATVLLHIGNSTDVQVPGKVYEYFGTGRPILCIRGNDADTSAELILRYNRGLVTPNRKEDIKQAILRMNDLWRRGQLDNCFSLGPEEEFTWKRQAGIMKNVIEEL